MCGWAACVGVNAYTRLYIYNMHTSAYTHAHTHVSPLAPVNDKLHKTRAGLMPSTGYNVDRAFFRLAMQETLIIIREYNAFIFRRMPELLACSCARARSRLRSRVERYRPRRALINDDRSMIFARRTYFYLHLFTRFVLFS